MFIEGAPGGAGGAEAPPTFLVSIKGPDQKFTRKSPKSELTRNIFTHSLEKVKNSNTVQNSLHANSQKL